MLTTGRVMAGPLLLIAEDDSYQLDQMAGWASRVGFSVIKAANGLDAYELFDISSPEIVVLDYHLPGMHGRELIQRLRNHAMGADTPIMIVTADGSRQTKIELLELGADDFIRKPLDPAEFNARLASLARKSALVINLENVTAERDQAYRDLEERAHELSRLTLGLVASLERASSLNDTDTGNHIQRVCRYAELLAQGSGCDQEFCEKVFRLAGLHDVGKVGIPDKILKKPGKLTVDEFDEMKTHTLIGGELLRAAGLPSTAVNVAFYHHERWDGSGYPHSLKGDEIPLEARIVSVADVFDALVTRRCYKPSFTIDKAVHIMRDAAGSQLDPHLVSMFLQRQPDVVTILTTYSEWLEEDETWA